MLSALTKLSVPMAKTQRQAKIGTWVMIDSRPLRADHQLDHGRTADGQLVTASGKWAWRGTRGCPALQLRYNPSAGVDLRNAASIGNADDGALAIAGTSRPDTQVD